MKNTLTFVIALFVFCYISANDGAYYGSGNHLIPIIETQISVQKEILTITRLSERTVGVDVYYEFYNPGEYKKLIVGFEAFSPSGDVDGTPKHGEHPYMQNFTVNINNRSIPYKIAYIEDSLYVENGRIKSLTLQKAQESIYNENCVEFFYVYHFDAEFKPGVNIVEHTYEYQLSGSVDSYYDFNYVLTAANRWSNKQIDDFTLIIDMGEFETVDIEKTFFTSNSDWSIVGKGKLGSKSLRNEWTDINKYVEFHMHHGSVTFHKKNFRPEAELYLFSKNPHFYKYNFGEDFLYLPFSYYIQDAIDIPQNEFEHKILRNLPYARRGYIFKDQKVQSFYDTNVDWYIPNPDYIPNAETLHEKEKEWLEYCKTIKK